MVCYATAGLLSSPLFASNWMHWMSSNYSDVSARHRYIRLPPQEAFLGPVYIYANLLLIRESLIKLFCPSAQIVHERCSVFICRLLTTEEGTAHFHTHCSFIRS